MRSAMATAVAVALIGLVSSIVTVVFEKESDRVIEKIIYQEANTTAECEKQYHKIILTDK